MNFCNWFLERCGPSVGYAQGIGSTILQKKLVEGWVNPEAGYFYIAWSDALEESTNLTAVERSVLTVARDCVCLVVDQDSHFLMRKFYFLEKLFERKDQLTLIPVSSQAREVKAGNALIAINTPEWQLVHRMMKGLILPMLGVTVFAKMKKKNKYKTPEAEMLRECIEWVITMDKPMRQKGLDHIRAAYESMRDITCVITEENPRIRMFVRRFFSHLAAHESCFRIAMHRQRGYWNWEVEYRKLKQEEQKILDNITREPDDLAIAQDPLRYRREAEEELRRLRSK